MPRKALLFPVTTAPEDILAHEPSALRLTAFAGAIGSTVEVAVAFVRRSLAAQQQYGGSASNILKCDGAAFGLRLLELVPEDRFDRQPWSCDELILTADVRLDNRGELERLLGREPAALSKISDSELLFRLWRELGTATLPHLIGNYAFAIFEPRPRRLTLVRDPIGQRPLFWSVAQGVTRFASMPSGLLCGARPEFNLRRFAQRLKVGTDSGSDSWFAGISRVRPGHTVTIEEGGEARESCFWAPSTVQREESGDLVSEYRALLDTAVGASIRRSSGPIASHLSSGYDSSAIAATAARLSGEEILAFTSAPYSRQLAPLPISRNPDEAELAETIAGRYGMRHLVVRSAEQLLQNNDEYSRYYQEPQGNPLNVGWWGAINDRASQLGSRMILTGEVGNVTLNAGGLPALGDWLEIGFLPWLREARAVARSTRARWSGILLTTMLVRAPPRFRSGLESLRDRHFVNFVRRGIADEKRQPWHHARSFAEQRLAVLKAGDPGQRRKGALARHSIDERDVMADRRIIEFSLQLPARAQLFDGVTRPLARAALEDRLPRAIIDNQVRGYQGADWVSRFPKERALELVEEISSCSSVHELLDLPKLKSACEDWPRIEKSSPRQLECFGKSVTHAIGCGLFMSYASRNSEDLGKGPSATCKEQLVDSVLDR